MPHKSRLATIVIDCRTDDLDRATAFWAGALGVEAQPFKDPASAGYRALVMPRDQPTMITQEALGARKVAFVKRWWVMEAPTGQRFCVVPPQRPDFPEGASEWP